MTYPAPDRYLLKPYMMETPALAQLARRIVDSGCRAASPIIVGWLLTPRCQLNCRHCWVKRNQPEAHAAEREKIAWKLAEANICRLSLSGGEVTLLPDLAHIVKILKSAGVPICIYTNAIAPLGPTGAETWLDHWDFETDYVQVSLDGGNARQFECQRGKDTFELFLKGVNLLHRLGVRTMAHYVATPYNGGDVYSAAKLAFDLGCAGFSAELFYPEGKAASISYAETQETARDFNASLEQMLPDSRLMTGPMELGIAIPIAAPFPSFLRQYKPQTGAPLKIPVRNGTLHCFVTPAGKVVPAGHLENKQDFWCGSLLEQDLGEIWKNGPGFARVPRFRDLSATRCADCPDFWLCGGGREERAKDFYGVYNAPDPYCHHIKLSPTHP
jgi:radical SAM protein with 4Fe4S-binding SPASM domain